MDNIYNISSPIEGKESIKKLYKTDKVSIEYIRSNNCLLSEWYCQDEDEWLVLFEGEAVLEVEGKTVRLQRGDTLFIGAQQRHQIISTSSNAQWLTVHMDKTLT